MISLVPTFLVAVALSTTTTASDLENKSPPYRILVPTVPGSGNTELLHDLRYITQHTTYTFSNSEGYLPKPDGVNRPIFEKSHYPFRDSLNVEAANVILVLKSHRHPISNFDSRRRSLFEGHEKNSRYILDFSTFGQKWSDHHRYWIRFCEESSTPLFDFSFEDYIQDRPSLLIDLFSNTVLKHFYPNITKDIIEQRIYEAEEFRDVYVHPSKIYPRSKGIWGEYVYDNNLKEGNLRSNELIDFVIDSRDLLLRYEYGFVPSHRSSNIAQDSTACVDTSSTTINSTSIVERKEEFRIRMRQLGVTGNAIVDGAILFFIVIITAFQIVALVRNFPGCTRDHFFPWMKLA